MAKLVLAIAAALLAAMTAVASAQGYGGQRGYGGPLYIGPNFEKGGQHETPLYGSDSYSKKKYNKKRTYRAKKKPSTRDSEDVDTAKTAPAEEEEKEATSENSSISGQAADTVEPSAPKKTEKASGPENSTIARAGSSEDGTAVAKGNDDAPKESARKVGCKKYFPTSGVTLTVPCD